MSQGIGRTNATLVLASLAAIGSLTLAPASGAVSPIRLFCVLCGDYGTPDLVGNVPNVRVYDYRPDAIPVGVADAVTIEPEQAGDYVEYQAAFAAGLAWANWQLTVWVPASDLRCLNSKDLNEREVK